MRTKLAFLMLLIITALLITSCNSEPEPVGPPLEGELTDLAAEFIANLVKEDYSSAASFFNADMRKAISDNALRHAWQSLLRQNGSYEGEIEMRVEQAGEYTAVNVITAFAEGPINIRVVFDLDNRVAGLWFQPA